MEPERAVGHADQSRYAAAWAQWSADLTSRLRLLQEGRGLLVSARAELARPHLVRRGRLGGFLPARHEPASPWVALVRDEDHVRGSCVGAESFGGAFPISPDEDAALLALGWHHPGPMDGPDYIRWWPDDVAFAAYLPQSDAAAAVTTTARTVHEVYGAADPAALTIEDTDPSTPAG